MFFVFDPWRSAVLLVAGDKAGQWRSWYERAIPQAKKLYATYQVHPVSHESGRESRRREQVRLAAVESFERLVPVPKIAAELRVSERPVQRWRRAGESGGAPGLASKGQAARCRLSGDQLAKLDRLLAAGPATAGWADQRWPGPGSGT